MSVPAVLAQTGGLGNPLAVLLFPILFGILVGGPFFALLGIVLALWRRGHPFSGARVPRWLGLYAFAANTVLLAYLLASSEFAPPQLWEWAARTALVLGLLAMALGVWPLLAAPEGRRWGAAWVLVMASLATAAVMAEREGGRRRTRKALIDAASDGDVIAVRAGLDRGLDEELRVHMLYQASAGWDRPWPRVAELLLRAGTNPNRVDAKKGASPWGGLLGGTHRRAEDSRRIETIRLFLAHGADPNAHWAGATPAFLAWVTADTELRDLLRATGARDVDAHEPAFRSLVDAARRGDVAKVRALRAAGVPLVHGGEGGMDLHPAVGEEGQTEVLRIFTSEDYHKCEHGDAALLAAARRGHQETVAFLLTTCLTLQGVDAATAAAEEAGHVEIGRLIRARPREY